MPHIDLPDGVPGILGPMMFRPETAAFQLEGSWPVGDAVKRDPLRNVGTDPGIVNRAAATMRLPGGSP